MNEANEESTEVEDEDEPTHFEDGTPIGEGDTVIVLRNVDGDMVPFIYTPAP